ncbi:MAG: Lrp/AsnC ligand binding domain-containing protein [Candidatus Hadarchaeales archaeon]
MDLKVYLALEETSMISMQAIVYIRTTPGKALKALEKIKKIPQVRFAAATTGRFDIVVRVEVSDIRELGECVVNEIQKIEGVTYTETAVIVTT